jgi:hypothetical protein
MTPWSIGFVTTLCIILIWIVSLWETNNFVSSTLPGFYQADVDFCKRADMKRMFIFIQQPKAFSRSYDAYIVIQANHGVVLDKQVTMKISEKWLAGSNWLPFFSSSSYKYYTVEFEEDLGDVLPQTMDMKFDITNQSMRFTDDDKLYIRVYRQGAESEMCSLNTTKENQDKPEADE